MGASPKANAAACSRLRIEAQQQASEIATKAKTLASLRAAVLEAVGGSATKADQEMIELLNQAALHLSRAASAFADARQLAGKAEAKLVQQARTPKAGTKR